MNKEIKNALEKEKERQYNNIELIASENYTSKSVMDLCGSILTNKYAEGYPSKRYYGGCENVDEIENLAIKYVTELFHVKYANVQPHSGSSANMAVYKALLNIGDKILGMDLNSGGHLTHGSPFSFSGKDYKVISYGVNKDEVIDYEKLEEIALNEKPQLIIAGASAYSRKIDFKKFREIADKCGAYLMVDMAHIAGLVAAGYHENPCDYADVVTSTTHKTLRGPRGGFILTNDIEIFKKIQKSVFPGIQGGPLMHIIGGKAQAFYEASTPDFKEYIKQVINNTKTMSDTFIKNGYKVVSNGTDNHLLLLDVTPLTGKEAETLLDEINITVNKNMIPFDKNTANVTSGIRIGSPAMTTRGLKEEDFKEIALIIIDTLKNNDSKDNLKKRVSKIIKKCNF